MKLPCRKCPQCGLYHDLSVTECGDCGRSLADVPALLTQIDEIPGDKYGDIEPSVPVFVQKCPACGALSFTHDSGLRVQICHNCHRRRIAAIEPVPYNENEQEESPAPVSVANEANVGSRPEPVNTVNAANTADDDDDDDDVNPWLGRLHVITDAVGKRNEAYGAAEPQPPKPERPAEPAHAAGNDRSDRNSDDYDDDDDDTADWADLIGGKPNPERPVPPALPVKHTITLTAIRYGSLSFTLDSEKDSPYLLGRAQNHGDFLSADGRVSSRHCSIYFKNGSWYVKDENSANGTAVNSVDIGLGGVSALHDGAELKLGHMPDSMAFRVRING